MRLLILYVILELLCWLSMQVIAHAWNSWYADHEEQKLFKDELRAKEESLKYGRERCHDLEKSLKDQDGTIFNLMTRIEQLEMQLRGFQAQKEAHIQDMARIEQLETQLRGFQAGKEAHIEDQEALRLQLQVSFL